MGKRNYLFFMTYTNNRSSRFSVFGKLKFGLRICGISALFVLFGLAVFLLGTQRARAASPGDVVINEVMVNPDGTDTGLEWIELYNTGTEEVVLSSYDLYAAGSYYTFGSFTLNPGAYVVVHINLSGLDTVTDLYQDISGNMSNTSGTIALFSGTTHSSSTIVDFIRYGATATTWQSAAVATGIWNSGDYVPVVSEGNSMGRLPNGQDTDVPTDWTNFAYPTPGQENSVVITPPPPNYPDGVLELVNLDNALIYQAHVSQIIDGDTIDVAYVDGLPSTTIRLLFVDTPEKNQPFYDEANDFTEQLLGQTVDLIISQYSDEQKDQYERTLAVMVFQDQVFNTRLLENGLASFYNYDNAVLKKEVWLAILQEAQQEKIGLWESAANIILSELLPNPVGLDSEGEWVEIYNPNDGSVALSRYGLDNFAIPDGTIIGPKSYLVLHRVQTGIALGNSGDTVKLLFPGGLSIDEVVYDQSSEGKAWALIDGMWYLTSRLTPGEANILEETLDDVDTRETTDENIPINSTPINIKTGEYRNFENYLVTITGTVVETSGNTFYLDDGSGKAKVYIQAATGIDKPEMHKGDIFQVTGIVNLYRDTWRILPQKQDDIKLIQQVQKDIEVKASTAKKSTAKTTSTSKKSTASTTKARSPTDEQIAGTTNGNNDIQVAGAKSPWWVQITKAILGLAIILLGLLIFKIIQYRRTHPSVSSFGDET